MNPITILHLEDNVIDVQLIEAILSEDGLRPEILLSKTGEEYVGAIERGNFDIIMSDSGVPGFTGRDAFNLARQKCPEIPFFFVSAHIQESEAAKCLREGAADYIRKDQLWRLAPSIKRALANPKIDISPTAIDRHNRAMQLLVTAVQELSLARDIDRIATIVRHYARELNGADGATFVLREGDNCYYAEENAIQPLWKGRRFPMSICISGWCMQNQQQIVIEDIYNDTRIPIEAYRPTFVKSLVMVPIRTKSPIGAIGNYWANHHQPTLEEINVIQALADSTSLAIENVQVYTELEERVKDRTAKLELANQELEAFSYTVSHDLRSPLTIIQGFSGLLQMRYSNQLEEKAKHYINLIDTSIKRMNELIDDMLALHQIKDTEIKSKTLDLSSIAREILTNLQITEPQRQVEIVIQENLLVDGDLLLLTSVLQNLLSNAWKYSSQCPQSRIEFGSSSQSDDYFTFYVRDNGVGFNITKAEKVLFKPFQRLHSQSQFPGTGIGLVSVQRIIHKHGGRIWADSAVNRGATFYFTLPRKTLSSRLAA